MRLELKLIVNKVYILRKLKDLLSKANATFKSKLCYLQSLVWFLVCNLQLCVPNRRGARRTGQEK